jgi:DNA-damage-inducible protein J
MLLCSQGEKIMSSVTVQSRVNLELKQEAAAVFEAMGMSTGDAIRMFLQYTVNTGRLPFQPAVKIPNAETQAAMQEAREGKTTRYADTAEMFKDLGI